MKYFTLYCLLLNTLNIFGQRVELRPNAVWSFHNIAKVQAVGLKLDALVKISGKHYLYSGFELIHGEGNAGLKNIQSTGVYSYNFDDPSTGQTSAWAYLFKDATLLKAKSARLHQAALKTTVDAA